MASDNKVYLTLGFTGLVHMAYASCLGLLHMASDALCLGLVHIGK